MTEQRTVTRLFLTCIGAFFLLFIWGLSVCLSIDGPLYSLGVLWQLAKGIPIVLIAFGVAKAGIEMHELHSEVTLLYQKLHELNTRN